jgi:HSP20 family protein
MRIVHLQPFPEMDNLRRQMERMFDESAGLERKSDTDWTPAIEIQERETSLILRAEIPGVESKDIDIQVAREAVSIAGKHRYEKKTEEKGFFRSELRYGSFQRTISLPVAVENTQVEAEFKNGILQLTLPKVQEARHRVVKVCLGAENQEALASVEANTQSESNREQTANSNN